MSYVANHAPTSISPAFVLILIPLYFSSVVH